MIIECGSCNSRFRLDASKITGRGARVRCRKCGEAITVLKEEPEGQAETGAAGPEIKDEGLDLRSLLRETMEAPEAPGQPAAASAGADALQSEFEKLMAEAEKEADVESAAPPADEPPPLGGDVLRSPDAASAGAARAPEATGAPATAPQAVEFGPEEKLTFQQPARKEAPAAPAPPQAPPDAPASTSEFMMSTADSLDFLKADYNQGEQKAALDISGSLRIAPATGTDDVRNAPPLGTPAAPPPEPRLEPPSRSEAIRSELAGLAGAGAAAAGKGPAAPSRDRVAAPPAPPAREAMAPRPSPPVRRTPPRKSASMKRGQGTQLVRPSVVLLLLLFFALAGGGAYLGFTSDGQKVLRGLVPQVESLWLRDGGKPASRYEVGNVAGYYETIAAAGKLFVVKGQVTNQGQVRKVGVRVYAALLDAQSRILTEKTIYAGNVLAADALRRASREKIEEAMSNPIGGGLANIDLPPGKSVPFMVVFFDAPDGVDSYRVEPREAD